MDGVSIIVCFRAAFILFENTFLFQVLVIDKSAISAGW